MAKQDRVESLVSRLRQSKRQGKDSLPAAKRRALVREFGIDAVRALLIAEHPNWQAEVFEFGADSTCPWSYAGLTPAEVARRGLGPLAKRLPRLLEMLGRAELAVSAQHAPEPDAPDLGGWFIVYAVPTNDGPQLWIAGPPEPEPAFEVADWKLPEPLRELYARHHGLGALCDEFGWTGVDPGVQPTTRLSTPSIEIEGGSQNPADFLRFTRGTGEAGESGWCFVRNLGHREALAIVQLDDALGQLGTPAPFDFWGFLDRYLTGD